MELGKEPHPKVIHKYLTCQVVNKCYEKGIDSEAVLGWMWGVDRVVRDV